MGAWSHQPFDNDNALDWVCDLSQHADLAFIITTLERAHTDDLFRIYKSYTDTQNVDHVLAAAEVVAALYGQPHPMLPNEVQLWLKHTKPASSNIIRLASDAVPRALQTLALRNLWAEPSMYELWVHETEGLLSRLRTATPQHQ